MKHAPRIKVCRGLKWDNSNNGTIPILGIPRVIGNVDLTQDEFAQIVNWITINKEVLLSYSKDEMYTNQMFELIKPV